MRRNSFLSYVFWKKNFLKLGIVSLLSFFLLPTFALAANNDPFRSGREAVNPKQSAGVGQSTGAMTYSYPFTIPPGRNGVQPSLSLNYSSDDKRQDSLFGYGWSMSLPYIERVNKTGTNNLYNQDRSHTFFTSSLSGELLPVVNSTPVGGSFLAFMQGISALALLDVPGDSSSSGTIPDSPAAVSEQSTVFPGNTTSVSNETARSFHTFQDTFLPMRVYHPNEEAEFAALREQASRDAKAPIPGFPVAKQKAQNPTTSTPTRFAEIDQNGIVLRIIVIDQSSINTGLWGNPQNWIQTSLDGSLRKNFAGKGYFYDRTNDIFIPPTPITATSTIPASFYVASSTPM